jgi:ATP-binding protein involved in chromosome partitioning
VGKSTVAVNLAVALAQSGARTGLLDADIYGPSIPIMTGVQQMPQSRAGKILPLEAHGLRLMSLGFLMPEGAPTVWRGPMVAGAIQQFLRDVDWGALDYLVIDWPPGTGDAQLTLAQSLPLTGVIVVLTPQDVATQIASKALGMFQQLKVPILGILENMSGFVCPHCGTTAPSSRGRRGRRQPATGRPAGRDLSDPRCARRATAASRL